MLFHKKLGAVFPNETLILIVTYIISLSLTIWGLSIQDTILALLLDNAVAFIFILFEKRLFDYLCPQFKVIREYDFELIDRANTSNQKRYFQELSKYPFYRACFATLFSYLKILPGALFVVSKMSLPFSFSTKLAIVYLTDSFVLILFFAQLYIQLQQMCSERMNELKDDLNWKVNYHELKLPETMKDHYFTIQRGTITLLLFNFFTISLYLTYTNNKHNLLSLIVLFSSALICILHIMFKFQKFFHESLKSMFSYLDQDFSAEEIKVLPLHTTPLLAGFESTINQLGHNLQEREKEIKQWLKYESEQFHMRSLGEITALVAHDIKTPLHVMQMSLEMMNNPLLSNEKKEEYKLILEKNLNQTIDFTKSIMAYLRHEENDFSCSFKEIHEHLLALFETQFPQDQFKLIQFHISENAQEINLKISKLDAMHIFYNIYSNAIKSVLRNTNISQPEIIISTTASEDFAEIYIKDNGLGLSPERFEQLTNLNRFDKSHDFKKGLGLRITKTLVEYLQGTLSIAKSDVGAILKVKLPTATHKFNYTSSENLTELTLN